LGWQKTVAAGLAFFTECGKCPSLFCEATAPHNCRLVGDLGYVDRNASGGSGILPGLFYGAPPFDHASATEATVAPMHSKAES
jgi:hypothetical protein